MIGRGYLRGAATAEEIDSSGFDSFDLRLGDLMRGERATMGKSLLDVQRELKIKAAYIAAIENADPSAFDTPGFIAGYVRSYARYLNMDPDWAYDTFCRESGFAGSPGIAAGPVRAAREEKPSFSNLGKDIFAGSATPFLPAPSGVLANIEPRAVGSVAVLLVLLSGLGYGGWMVLREVQKVTFAPVEQAPTVIADVDPLAGGARPDTPAADEVAGILVPSAEALDRLYRPEALDVPVLVPRDGPIAALLPAAPSQPGTAPTVGGTAMAAAPGAPTTVGPGLADSQLASAVDAAVAGALASADAIPDLTAPAVQVTGALPPAVQLVAARAAWVRVRGADGSVLFEGILNPGDTYEVPATEESPTLRVGESGALYMAINGVPHGPVGPSGTVSDNVPLSAESIVAAYQPADLTQDADLAEAVRVAELAPPASPILPEAGTQAIIPGVAGVSPAPLID